ncbi:MAG: hypothetical protein DMG70_02405 [Acidobacteria bacterium]|nr:MAG: hypothetical protein DMG70_02405 [Acidobacteriota bacterium]
MPLRQFKRKRTASSKACPICGEMLKLRSRRKYDPFWILVLVFAGAASAFYLVGIAVIVMGLWLLSRKQSIWLCPRCVSGDVGSTF